ncbi:MAG: hypothetical protein BroJett011_30120 [Chloroflexota bacterium]|nr:MAG: hypothetical protein BroJett011_30120 [Chloroflexota bacterium]
MSTKLGYFLILILLLVAFALRLGHLLAGIFHIDEYISMLAAQMTAQKGAPFLPSGLLYHQGLLLSYLAAPLIKWAGFREEIARWPSLLAGVLAVAAFYQVGRRILYLPLAGLLALTLAAFDPEMILWSARMRMYALASLLMLLGFYFLLQGVLLHPNRFDRLLGVAFYLGAILAHSVAVVALPVWSLALLIGLWLGQRKFKFNWYRQKPIILELVIAGVLLAIGIAFAVGGQIPFLSPGAAADSGGNGGGGGLQGVFNKFLDPGFSWQRIDDFIYIYTTAEYWPMLILAALSFGLALLAVIRGRLTRRDLAVICLGLVFLLTIAELGLALTSTWRKTRYLFILCHPPFLLLAADGLTRVFEKLPRLLTSRPPTHSASSGQATDRRPLKGIPLLPTPYSLLPVFLIAIFWASPALSVALAKGTGGYHTIFRWVGSQWQEGDRVMTVHPSAAYLYLGRSDYYATQGTARVFADDESEELVDRYVGSTLVDSVEGLDKALAESSRLWFVVDNNRLFSRYEPLFIQQVFAQMNVQRQDSGVLVFLSQPYPRPLPAEPLAELQANFSDLITLAGYSLNPAALAPDRTVQLALYWRPQTAQIQKPYKVFVQLRDGQNQTVAQADHFIYEGLLTGSMMGQLKNQGEWLRDSADLVLPENLPPGSYRLFVGLYDPTTLERVPLTADTSGENAVLLETISSP